MNWFSIPYKNSLPPREESGPLILMTYFFLKKFRWLNFTRVSIDEPKRGIIASIRDRNKQRNSAKSLGDHKREHIVAQLKRTCVSLQEAKEGFEGALEQFDNLVYNNASAMEHQYYQLSRQFKYCHSKSHTINNRIKKIKNISQALFAEWADELNVYSSRTLRNSSKQQLKAARRDYAELLKVLQTTEKKIWPILTAFHDQVLYLKHNINTRTISALHHEFIEISLDISELIVAMEATIAEANQFVSVLIAQKPRRPLDNQ